VKSPVRKTAGKTTGNHNKTGKIKSDAQLLKQSDMFSPAPELFNALINSTSNGIYMVQDGKFIFVSPQFTLGTEYSEDEDIAGYGLRSRQGICQT
jgi:PAS domain-containing protein